MWVGGDSSFHASLYITVDVIGGIIIIGAVVVVGLLAPESKKL